MIKPNVPNWHDCQIKSIFLNLSFASPLSVQLTVIIFIKQKHSSRNHICVLFLGCFYGDRTRMSTIFRHSCNSLNTILLFQTLLWNMQNSCNPCYYFTPDCKNNTAYWYGNFHAKHPVRPFVNGWPPALPPSLDNPAP